MSTLLNNSLAIRQTYAKRFDSLIYLMTKKVAFLEKRTKRIEDLFEMEPLEEDENGFPSDENPYNFSDKQQQVKGGNMPTVSMDTTTPTTTMTTPTKQTTTHPQPPSTTTKQTKQTTTPSKQPIKEPIKEKTVKKEETKQIKPNVNPATDNNLTHEEMKQLESWTSKICGEVVFDSNKDNWSKGTSVFNDRIEGRNRLVFLIEDTNGEKFGYYLNTMVEPPTTGSTWKKTNKFNK